MGKYCKKYYIKELSYNPKIIGYFFLASINCTSFGLNSTTWLQTRNTINNQLSQLLPWESVIVLCSKHAG